MRERTTTRRLSSSKEWDAIGVQRSWQINNTCVVEKPKRRILGVLFRSFVSICFLVFFECRKSPPSFSLPRFQNMTKFFMRTIRRAACTRLSICSRKSAIHGGSAKPRSSCSSTNTIYSRKNSLTFRWPSASQHTTTSIMIPTTASIIFGSSLNWRTKQHELCTRT